MMKWKIRVKLGSEAEEGEILNIQANKDEKFLSLQRLDVKACGQQKLQEL